MSTTTETNEILGRAILRLARSAKERREVITQKETGQAIAQNLVDNLLDIRWNEEYESIEIIPKKSTQYIH